MEHLIQELTRGGISLAVTLIGLSVGWFVGQRLTYQWNIRQKRREQDLIAAQDFQRLYGEFFSIWKLWNGIAPSRGTPDPDLRGELLRRSADAEGLVERLIVKLVTERQLSTNDRNVLGSFRQGYKRLRKAIEKGEPLGWATSDHPEYLAFKRLAVAVIGVVQRESSAAVGPEAFDALRDVTCNRHEKTWTNEKLG